MIGIFMLSCNHKGSLVSDAKVLSHLSDLYTTENYFKLRDYFEIHHELLSEKDQLYYRSIVKNSFNDHKASNDAIEKILNNYDEDLTAKERMDLHKTKFMNHYNLYEYNAAFSECTLLIHNYKPIMDSVKFVQMLNDEKILEALKNSPKQEIHKIADSWIKMTRDKLDLLNVSLLINKDSLDFLFDTGSSFSFIQRSSAERLKLEIFDVDIEVEGATGTPVICDLLLIPEFNLGNVSVRNAVFWVFDDSDLTLPEYDYSLNGAIGFPISRAMDEIHLIFEDSIFIPRIPVKYSLNNLAMDDLDPVIAIVQDQDTLPYYFDTGAAFSSLYKPYYVANSLRIDSTYHQHTFSIGSLGGTKEFTCYIIDSLQLELAGRSAWIYDIETHMDPIYKDNEKVYGNLGQDFIFQFSKMIISTKHSSVLLE